MKFTKFLKIHRHTFDPFSQVKVYLTKPRYLDEALIYEGTFIRLPFYVVCDYYLDLELSKLSFDGKRLSLVSHCLNDEPVCFYVSRSPRCVK